MEVGILDARNGTVRGKQSKEHDTRSHKLPSDSRVFILEYKPDQLESFHIQNSYVLNRNVLRIYPCCPVAVLVGKTLYWRDSLEDRSGGELSHHPREGRVNSSRRFRVTCLGDSRAACRLPSNFSARFRILTGRMADEFGGIVFTAENGPSLGKVTLASWRTN